jgi:hypothetical protein
MDPARSGDRNTGWATAVGAVLVRPWLWPAAVGMVIRMVPRRWWRRRPWLPVPDGGYLRFRMVTAFGARSGAPPARELVSYLAWLRAWPQVVRR